MKEWDQNSDHQEPRAFLSKEQPQPEICYCLKRLLPNVQPTVGKELEICNHKDQRHPGMVLQRWKYFLLQMPGDSCYLFEKP